MKSQQPVFYTIGHSTHPFDVFLRLLQSHQIQALVDVRSSPYSNFAFGEDPGRYGRDVLSHRLEDSGIRYLFLGDKLGARRSEEACYEEGKVNYRKVATLPSFREGVKQLKEVALKMKVAIMCAEKDPLECHRAILITCFTRKDFADVRHILADSKVETRKEADERLLKEEKLIEKNEENLLLPLEEHHLPPSPEERLDLAYARRAEKIAYSEAQNQVAYG